MMTTYLFPGQGSQQKGMGEGLFETFPELTAEADAILGYSIRTLCLEDPQRQLNHTQYTQPALYVVNALAYQQKLQQTEIRPDFVAGHSLGEYNALQASGALSFTDGLKLVQKRGELMSQAPAGVMAAILNLTAEAILATLEAQGVATLDIANHNAPTQIVISGLPADLATAQPLLEQAGGLFIPLNTSGAFHSRYMADAKAAFTDYLQTFQFGDLAIPVIANVIAKPYEPGQIVTNLSGQITSTVQWLQSMEYLLAQGETEFEELGVGDVLTKLTAKIQPDSATADPSAQERSAVAVTDETPVATESSVAEASATEVSAAKDTEPGPTPTADELPQSTAEEIIADLGLSLDAATETTYANKIAAVQQRIAEWNQTHPVGTSVSVTGYGDPLETRTQAMLLFGHRAAIYLKGHNGYFHLDEVTPVSATSMGVAP
jgi:malonyl CoA-acyl carrier protein transacylase